MFTNFTAVPIPANEIARLETLHDSGLLEHFPQKACDDIALLASHICETPISLVSLIGEKEQWLKSKVGIDANETRREHSFCAHAIMESELFIVPDAQLDARFASNPMVTDGPRIRFYAGAPLVTPEGHALGSLCVVDQTPRELNDLQKNALKALARQVMVQFLLRQQAQEMASLNKQLQRLSVRDELTGVNNRRAFNIALRRELVRAQRYNSPLSLVLLDVDNFKKYNDSFGHQAGDEVLRQVGALLPQHITDMAVAARYGGEEFALILPDTNAEKALCIAEQARLALEQKNWYLRAVTASLGVATTASDIRTEDELIAAADAALYASKSAGRNRATHARTLMKECRKT